MSTVYVAVLEGQDLRLIKDGDPRVAFDIEVYPVYGRDAADQWLEANGYDGDGRDWQKMPDSKPAIWSRVVSR